MYKQLKQQQYATLMVGTVIDVTLEQKVGASTFLSPLALLMALLRASNLASDSEGALSAPHGVRA